MKNAIILPLLLLTKILFAQSVNLIIQVNDKLIIDGLSRMYLRFDSTIEAKTIQVGYVPGELTLPEEIWKTINSDSSLRFSLHFDYNTFVGDKHQIESFYAELSPNILKERYLIVNIYDFRNRKYKRWYQWHTNEHFLAELRYPNSGLYIRKKRFHL